MYLIYPGVVKQVHKEQADMQTCNMHIQLLVIVVRGDNMTQSFENKLESCFNLFFSCLKL